MTSSVSVAGAKTRSAKVADVKIMDEVEGGLVNMLALAYERAFTASDLLKASHEAKDGLATQIRGHEFQIAKLGIQVAKRSLCSTVKNGRRNGELIGFAGRMADVGTRVNLDIFAEGASASSSNVACDGCGNMFSEQGLADHLSPDGCLKVQVDQQLADEHIDGIEDVVFCAGGCGKVRVDGNGSEWCNDCDPSEDDNSEVLDAQFGGSEAEISY